MRKYKQNNLVEDRFKWHGWYRAKCTETDAGEPNSGEVRVFIPDLMTELDPEFDEDGMGLIAGPANNPQHGQLNIPKKNEYVWVFFECGNPNNVFYTGALQLWNDPYPGAHGVPSPAQADPHPSNFTTLATNPNGMTVMAADGPLKRYEITSKQRAMTYNVLEGINNERATYNWSFNAMPKDTTGLGVGAMLKNMGLDSISQSLSLPSLDAQNVFDALVGNGGINTLLDDMGPDKIGKALGKTAAQVNSIVDKAKNTRIKDVLDIGAVNSLVDKIPNGVNKIVEAAGIPPHQIPDFITNLGNRSIGEALDLDTTKIDRLISNIGIDNIADTLDIDPLPSVDLAASLDLDKGKLKSFVDNLGADNIAESFGCAGLGNFKDALKNVGKVGGPDDPEGNMTSVLLDDRDGKEKYLIKSRKGDFIHFDIDEQMLHIYTTRDIQIKTGSNMYLTSAGEMHLKAGTKMNIESMGPMNIKSGAQMYVTSGAALDIRSSGRAVLHGANTYVQGGVYLDGSKIHSTNPAGCGPHVHTVNGYAVGTTSSQVAESAKEAMPIGERDT